VIKAKAYKVKDFTQHLGQDDLKNETANSANSTNSFDVSMIGGLVDDFTSVTAALKAFPFKSALSVVGFLAVVYVAFKAGTKFGIIKSRVKRKGK
jgi:hypothetical protein